MRLSFPTKRSSVWALALFFLGGCVTESSAPPSESEKIPDCAVASPLRRLTVSQYAHAITDLFEGHVAPSSRFPEPSGASSIPFSGEATLNAVDRLAAEQIMVAAEDVAVQMPGALPRLLDCPQTTDAECHEAFLNRAATLAFRRPLLDEEHDLLRGIWSQARQDGATLADATGMAVATLLQMPQFLYLLETGAGAGDIRKLDRYEVATRMAILLWDSIPDEALLATAEAGRLDTDLGLAAEARRMLDDAKAGRMARRFFREWLQVELLSPTARDTVRYPWFDAAWVASVSASFDRYAETAISEGWSLETLLTHPQVPIDVRLAEHLELSTPSEEWSWVDLHPARRAGIMGHPAVMASHAHFDTSSYVSRGRFVVSGLLCRPLGEPPSNANTEFAAIRSSLPTGSSRRELSVAVRQTPACGFCHRSLDPPGLAFENFDATGRWQDVDRYGNRIEAVGELEALQLEFDSPGELMEKIAARAEARDCFERHLFRYFASRLEGPDDACALEHLRSEAPADTSVAETWMALMTSEAFRYRKMAW